jgi:hypothetical protein
MNDIIWDGGRGARLASVFRNHDIILLYRKSGQYCTGLIRRIKKSAPGYHEDTDGR